MKKIIALFLVLTLCLSSCKSNNNPGTAATSNTTEGVAVTKLSETTVISDDTSYDNSDTVVSSMVETTEQVSETTDYNESEEIPEFYSMDDPAFLEYVENSIYSELVADLDSADYFVENVQATYMPDEYYESLAFNSQENIYFGHTVSELNEVFQGKKYVFDLGDDGQTVVKEMEILEDNTEKEIIKNVAIGTGVILVCVTVSFVTAGLGAPTAVTAIFSFAAAGAKAAALDGAIFGGITAAIVKGYETRNFKAALNAAALGASEGFKWGAIIGAIVNGGGEAIGLIGAARNGLTMSEAAIIQKETKLPLKFIKQLKSMSEYEELVQIAKSGGLSLNLMSNICLKNKWPIEIVKKIHSIEEYNIYKNLGLKAVNLNGRVALVQKIDLKIVDEAGRTNAQRLALNLTPLDETGVAFEWHHIGQSSDSPYALLKRAEHRGAANNKTLHWKSGASEVDHGADWNNIVKDLWDGYSKLIESGGI